MGHAVLQDVMQQRGVLLAMMIFTNHFWPAAYWDMSKDWINEKVGTKVLGAKSSTGEFLWLSFKRYMQFHQKHFNQKAVASVLLML